MPGRAQPASTGGHTHVHHHGGNRPRRGGNRARFARAWRGGNHSHPFGGSRRALARFCAVLGSVAGGRRWPGAGLLHLAACLGAALALGALNAMAGINSFNYPLILLMSVSACGVLLTLPLPRTLCAPALWFDACVLEIYFLHSYLFVRPDGLPPAAGFLMSMAIVLLVSLSVARLRARLTHGSTGQHRQQAA